MIYKSTDSNYNDAVGGKAKGLYRLIELGYRVPQFMVITPAGINLFLENPATYLAFFGEKALAVRSSGLLEDGATHSYAGQYETYLGVSGQDNLVKAVQNCMASGLNQRVASYAESDSLQKNQVAVILQEMVNAQCAGVAFSADPITHRRDLISITAVTGLGDKLVDGKANGESLVFSKYNNEMPIHTFVSLAVLTQIKAGLIDLSLKMKHEIDAEWAVNEQGDLCWLQARPITTLDTIHVNELDSVVKNELEVLTRANIGEMMPGFLSPLSLSTFGKAIEVGIQDFFTECGVQDKLYDEHLYIKYFYNHGFISLSGLYTIADGMLLPKYAYIDYSILGRTLKTHFSLGKKRSFLKQLINQVRQFRYLGQAAKRLKKLEALVKDTHQPENLDKTALFDWLESQIPNLNQAYSYHYCTSARSGSMYTALISIISGSSIPTAESNTTAALFLKNIDHIVGNDALHMINQLTRAIQVQKEVYEPLSDEDFVQKMKTDSGDIGKIFRSFMAAHGHRCVREAELSEKDWSQDPAKLVGVIRTQLQHTSFLEKKTPVFNVKQELKAHLPKTPFVKRVILASFIKKTRAAIVMREETKSLAVKFQQKLKFAYLDLGHALVQEGLIEAVQDIFYLQHHEIGLLLSDKLSDSKAFVQARKKLEKAYKTFQFQELYTGHPYPLDTNLRVDEERGTGTIVSHGVAKGKVKIVRTLAEADKIEKGDIMVCQYTDIGWSPYFALIGGIITEIGSPLSHGAVVAREYGIPAIVNRKNAMLEFSENEVIEINTGASIPITRLINQEILG